MPGPQPVVRAAADRDDAALLAVDDAAWSPASGFPSLAGQVRSSFFTESGPREDYLVAELEGRVVGYVRLKHSLPMVENAHVLAILGVAVAPSAQGRGVGSALLRAAEEEARGRGARKLSLRVLGTNVDARRLYERLGYVVEGVLLGEFHIGDEYVDDVLMARYLT